MLLPVASSSTIAASDPDLAPPPAKKTKIVDDEDASNSIHSLALPSASTVSSTPDLDTEEPNSDDDDDGRQLCKFVSVAYTNFHLAALS
jgi:hypothetical protein